MANRPNVQEILAAVRAAGPARPDQASSDDTSAPTSQDDPVRPGPAATAPGAPVEPEPSVPEPEAATQTPAANRPMTLQEKLAAARNRPADASPSQDRTPPKSPSGNEGQPPSPGRPLSVKEKLAAARNRPAEASQAEGIAGPSPVSAPGESRAEADLDRPEADAAGSPPVPAAPGPAAVGKALSLQEKLAAARGRPATESSKETPKGTSGSRASVGELSPTAEPASRGRRDGEESSETHRLAAALRRSGEDWHAPSNRTISTDTRGAGTTPNASSVPGAAEEPGLGEGGRSTGLLTSVAARWVLASVAVIVVGMTGVMVARRLSSDGASAASTVISVGLPSTIEPDTVVPIGAAAPPLWVVRSSTYDGLDTISALRGVCPDDGGRVDWSAEARSFRCPGGTHRFAISGLPLSGSNARALERYRLILDEDGQVAVDPSRTFREELGHWADSGSFLRVASED